MVHNTHPRLFRTCTVMLRTAALLSAIMFLLGFDLKRIFMYLPVLRPFLKQPWMALILTFNLLVTCRESLSGSSLPTWCNLPNATTTLAEPQAEASYYQANIPPANRKTLVPKTRNKNEMGRQQKRNCIPLMESVALAPALGVGPSSWSDAKSENKWCE